MREKALNEFLDKLKSNFLIKSTKLFYLALMQEEIMTKRVILIF